MQLNDFILESAQSGLALQANDGTFPPGHNGPYLDKETPVRNTSHWLMTMLKAYEISGKAIFKDAASKAAEYLTGDDARPMQATFFCRINPEKDFCNGLIGQAWVIEALIRAGIVLEDDRYNKLAKTVFLIHPFNENSGLWRIVNTDGSYRSSDLAFNHQLWFAAAGAMISDKPDGTIGDCVIRFLDFAQSNHLRIRRNGRIKHALSITPIKDTIRSLVYFFLNHTRTKMRFYDVVEREIGYHAFNLYAFAMLKKIYPGHAIWKTKKLISVFNYINSTEFINGIGSNRFAYPYNPPGFEIGYALQVFKMHHSDTPEKIRWWIKQQLIQNYDKSLKLLNRNTTDANTLAARFYEVTRIHDITI